MGTLEMLRIVPDWLAVSHGREVSLGLSREEALRRAATLRQVLQEGKIEPTNVVLDEDLKDVVHALGILVTTDDRQRGATLAKEANIAYQFVARTEWPADDFDEKRDLLRSLAEAGWRAVGASLADVSRSRALAEDASPGDNPSVDSVSSEAANGLIRGLATLRSNCSSSPPESLQEAVTLFEQVSKDSGEGCFFDECDYIRGSAAFSAGSALRFLGRLDEANEWMNLAERSFRKTIDPEPLVAIVGYGRLCILQEKDEFGQVVELMPDVRKALSDCGMRGYALKCDFCFAMALNSLGRQRESREILQGMRQETDLRHYAGLEGLVLLRLADFLQEQERYDDAVELLNQATSLLELSNYDFAKPDVRMVFGGLLRRQGRFQEAISTLQRGIREYSELGMVRRVAYARLLLAETLLALGQARDAEREILQALPILEELSVVPERFAAVALLRESVRQQKADPNALRELREHLQRQK